LATFFFYNHQEKCMHLGLPTFYSWKVYVNKQKGGAKPLAQGVNEHVCIL